MCTSGQKAQCNCSVWHVGCCCCCSSIRTAVPRSAGSFSVPRPSGSGSHDKASLSLAESLVSLRRYRHPTPPTRLGLPHSSLSSDDDLSSSKRRSAVENSTGSSLIVIPRSPAVRGSLLFLPPSQAHGMTGTGCTTYSALHVHLIGFYQVCSSRVLVTVGRAYDLNEADILIHPYTYPGFLHLGRRRTVLDTATPIGGNVLYGPGDLAVGEGDVSARKSRGVYCLRAISCVGVRRRRWNSEHGSRGCLASSHSHHADVSLSPSTFFKVPIHCSIIRRLSCVLEYPIYPLR
ncbi:hypothetical protein C8Q73DRAFT_510893 [Cubamyces lactineus]|nr:hypothetical protein C8Q73DRAFT_510893 [Cubamyces lactineus]